MFDYNASGVSMDGPLLPDGWFTFRIMDATEGMTRDGKNHLVKVRADVIQDEEFAGWPVYHYVTFLPKDNPGAGISLHFLKAIAEPFEGSFKVNAEDWVGKMFSGQVFTDTYKDRKSNKIKQVKALDKAGLDLF